MLATCATGEGKGRYNNAQGVSMVVLRMRMRVKNCIADSRTQPLHQLLNSLLSLYIVTGYVQRRVFALQCRSLFLQNA